MRKTGVAVLAAVIAACAVPAVAAQHESGFTASAVVGGYIFDGKEHLKQNPVVGLRGGYDFNKYLGLEGLFDMVWTAGYNSESARLARYGGDVLVNVLPDLPVIPYLAVGLGGKSLDVSDRGTSNHLYYDYGVGAKYFITDSIALRGDFRHILFRDQEKNRSNFEYTGGLLYAFGAVKAAPVAVAPEPAPEPVKKAAPIPEPEPVKKAAPAPEPAPVPAPPADTDGDGVIDSLDKCPGTPKGVTVDANGCPLDTDGDGVYDYLDKCPATPHDVKVDKDGCPIEKKITVHLNVEFPTGKTTIAPQYEPKIKEVADFLQTYPNTTAEIEGHTDNVGSKSFNQKLSLKRAEAVRTHMIKKYGISGKRITAKGYGMSKPIASNKTAEGRQKNRRIDATLETVTVEKKKK